MCNMIILFDSSRELAEASPYFEGNFEFNAIQE